MDVFTLMGRIKLDGQKEVNDELKKTSLNADNVKKGMKVMGAAFTAVGAIGLKLSSDARKMNATFAQTGLTIGKTTSEVRDLALATTNVTFPLASVSATFDLLSRAGIRDAEVLKSVSTELDTLGDAIGSSAEQVGETMVTAMKTFGLSVESAGQYSDDMTYLLKNTTLSMDNFASIIAQTTPEVVGMGLTMEDTIAMLALMEARGETGAVAVRSWRSALTEAEATGKSMNEVLGITQEEMDAYNAKAAEATGITQEYADAANTQYGIMDKVKQRFSELSLSVGSALTPMEPLLATMTGLGPILIAMPALIGGVGTAMKLLTTTSLGPIALALAAIVAVGVLVWKNWDTIKEKAGQLWGYMKDGFQKFVDFLKDWGTKIASIIFAPVVLGFRTFLELIEKILNGISKIPFIGDKVSGALGGIRNLQEMMDKYTFTGMVPGFAQGVTNFSGGMAIVGEQGPEIVSLPRGSNVTPTGAVTVGPVHIDVSGAQDPESTARAIRDILTRIAWDASNAAQVRST